MRKGWSRTGPNVMATGPRLLEAAAVKCNISYNCWFSLELGQSEVVCIEATFKG